MSKKEDASENSMWGELTGTKDWFCRQMGFCGTELEFVVKNSKKIVLWKLMGSGVPIISTDELAVTFTGPNEITIQGKGKFVLKDGNLTGGGNTFMDRETYFQQ